MDSIGKTRDFGHFKAYGHDEGAENNSANVVVNFMKPKIEAEGKY